MRVNRAMKEGFTLVELSLSIAFVGILSLAIALIINSSIKSYRRGLTLNQVNTVGMDLVDDMRAAVQNSSTMTPMNDCTRYYTVSAVTSSPYRNCRDTGGKNFVVVTRKANVKLKGVGSTIRVPIYGAFCTGSYSYIWNSGYFWSTDVESISPISGQSSISKASFSGVTEDFRLLKVRDDARGVCASAVRRAAYSGGTYSYPETYGISTSGISNEFTINGYGDVSAEEPPIDLLAKNGENDLVLYDLSVDVAEGGAQGNLFYSVSFILGTMQGRANITTDGRSCAAPNEYDGSFDYCAINKFNFAAQANGS